jgi:hypothetical protein
MKKFSRRVICVAASLTTLGMPMLANAESTVVTGAGALSASARLDFRVTIPKVLFLQVGTGTSMANNGAFSLIDFTVPAANVGDNSVIAATAGSGDLGSGAVTARVLGNGGDVTLTSTTAGPLGNGAGDTLSFAQIATAATTLVSTTALAAPALADGATTTTTVPAVGKIVNRDARWTFTYLNAAAVPPGTYGGVGVNNGRVTYTASVL